LYWGDKSPGTYLTLFGLSSVARAATLLALARVPAINVPGQSVLTRTLGVSAGDSTLEQPILPSMRDDGQP